MANISDVLKDIVNNSQYFTFQSYNPVNFELSFTCHEKVKEFNINFKTLVCPGNTTMHCARNEEKHNEVSFKTVHYLIIEDEQQRRQFTQLFNGNKIIIGKPNDARLSDQNKILSKKPNDNMSETLSGMLIRWGSYLRSENLKPFRNNGKNEVVVDNTKKLRVIYNPIGEITSYNSYAERNGIIFIHYDPSKKDTDFLDLRKYPSAKYIGAKVGAIDTSNAGINEKDRVIDLYGLDGLEYLKRLSSLNIHIIGLGGAGSNIVEGLIKKGAKSFTFYDNDVIEETNLSRLPLFCHGLEDKNIKKVDMFDAFAKNIDLNINKNGNLTSENINCLEDADIIIISTDNKETRGLVSKYCFDNAIPLIDAGIGYDIAKKKQKVSIKYHKKPGLGNYQEYQVTEDSNNEYGYVKTLQLADSCMFIASQVAFLITKLCGLYLSPGLTTVCNEPDKNNNGEEWEETWGEI